MKHYNTDKVVNGILAEYEEFFAPIKNEKMNIVEVGVYTGGSLEWASDYFKNSKIFGMDIVLPDIKIERAVLLKGNQNDVVRMTEIAEKIGDIDIVIDDGSHKRKETSNTFTSLWKYVLPGGWYIIEDWVAGFWEEYPEYAGMVDLVQKLIRSRKGLGISDIRLIIKNEKCSYVAFRKEMNRGFNVKKYVTTGTTN